MRVAVADLGTNSTRLLVADVSGEGRLTEVVRQTTVTQLGEGVDGSGRLAAEAIGRVLSALGGYREVADAAGAERSIAVATSAVRDAENGDELVEAVRERLGFDARTIDGDEEARLTFLGATSGRAWVGTTAEDEAATAATMEGTTAGAGSNQDGEALVVDIGGGSTELVTGRPGHDPSFHVSTHLGSVRQTERHLASDPPRHEELEALADEVREILAAAVPDDVQARVAAGIAVAGTATSLAAIDQALDPYDPERVDGYRLGLAACERMLARLAQLPLEDRREVTGLHPDRAPTIVAGAVILIEAMRLFGLDDVEVSEADVLDGAALDAVCGSGGPGPLGKRV
jgi:exopolyphosphatase / guanosine-5'-triphosphate,3'-diphosphate pyrophosphatase